MNTRRNILQVINKILICCIFMVITASIIVPTQEIHADASDFRSKYQLDENDLLVSLPAIPPLSYKENGVMKGYLYELAKAMDRIYQTQGTEIDGVRKKGRIVISGIYPFARSIRYVSKGFTDFHMPYMVNPLLTSEILEKEAGLAYSGAIIFYVTFSMYATKDFAQELSVFEKQTGKSFAQLDTQEDFRKFDIFLKNKGRTIRVDRAHTHFFPFVTESSSNNTQALKMLSRKRIDAYIHNMQECESELQTHNIDSTDIEKIEYRKFVVRMVVPATEKGNKTDKIISGLIWKLQGRNFSEVPLADYTHSGLQKEVPYNAYQTGEAFRNSEMFTIMKSVWDL